MTDTTNEQTSTEKTFPPSAVTDFSSQYGSNRSTSYVVRNIVTQEPNVYPSYGDSTNASVFRTYGPWWMILPSYQDTFVKSFPRTELTFNSRDFLDISYPTAVENCLTLNLYETYNPGTLEVVYAGEEIDKDTIKWHQVWKYPELFIIELKNTNRITITDGRQLISDLFPDDSENVSEQLNLIHINADRQTYPQIYTQHSYPAAARLPRILRIPLKDKISFPTRRFRCEFDHKCVDYYIEIDTITLTVEDPSNVGNKPTVISSLLSKAHQLLYGPNKATTTTTTTTQTIVVENQPIEQPENLPTSTSTSTKITDLPFDILSLICSQLDLRSLMRLSSTCRYLHQVCQDPLSFLSLNLQPYWNRIDDQSIERFFQYRCQKTRFLSLAWTKSIGLKSFDHLLRPCGKQMVQLNLSSCQFLKSGHIQIICDYCVNIELLNLDNCMSLDTNDFLPLTSLKKIRGLSVYRTLIDFRTLLPLINENSNHLEHLNLGSCPSLIDSVGIVRMIFARCSKLRSFDFWRGQLYPSAFLSIVQPVETYSDECTRFERFSAEQQDYLVEMYSKTEMPITGHSVTHMTQLTELDFGWTSVPTNFIKHLVRQAGHNLIKLFLTACRQISSEDVLAISQHCPRLRQFDILNCNQVSVETIEILLQRCSDLEFIDLSYCSSINNEHLLKWRSVYQCAFKRSYTPRDQHDVSTEFP